MPTDLKDDEGNTIGPAGFALDGSAESGQPTWDLMRYGFLNNFTLKTFLIRLNDGKNGEGGYWIANTNLANLATKGINVPWELLLLNNPKVQAGFWNTIGTPTHIDEIQFLLTALNDHTDLNLYPNPSIISYVHFRREPLSKTVSGETVPTLLIMIDRALTEQPNIDDLCIAEQERVKNTELVGSITVDGAFLYANFASGNSNKNLPNPGDGVELDLPEWGLINNLRRVDHIVHQAEGGRWLATIYFGPFMYADVLEIFQTKLELLMDAGGEDAMEAEYL